jgi:putative endonuclease
VLYIGVTANLHKRIYEHKNNIIPGFASKYKVHKLVYYEHHERIEFAIEREKYLKGKTRSKKVALITAANPNWEDLTPTEYSAEILPPRCAQGQDDGVEQLQTE